VPLAAAASANHTIPRSPAESSSTTPFAINVHTSTNAIFPSLQSYATGIRQLHYGCIPSPLQIVRNFRRNQPRGLEMAHEKYPKDLESCRWVAIVIVGGHRQLKLQFVGFGRRAVPLRRPNKMDIH